MVCLEKEDIRDFDLIGQGTFGKIYRKDDKIYKIYRKMIQLETGKLVKNPSLKYKKIKFNRLTSLNGQLAYNNLIDDLIFLNGKFKGVVMPYYEGVLLSKTVDKSLEEKIDITYQLIDNSKELTDHFIYPLDYKLNNMILVGDEVFFIDLDDYHTKVDLFVNVVHRDTCIKALDNTIKTYLCEFKKFPLSDEIVGKLQRPVARTNFSYEDIEEYVLEKGEKNNYIFINDRVDFNRTVDLLRKPEYRIVYVYKQENLDESINKLLNLGIDLYDAVSIYEIKRYMNSFLYNECLGIKEDRVLKLQK